MKIETKLLSAALSQAVAICSRKTTLSILSMVRLSSDGGNLSIVATDLDCRVTECVPGKGAFSPAICVPAKLLASCISGEAMEFTVGDKQRLDFVDAEGDKGGITGLDPAEFPAETESKWTVIPDGAKLADGLEKCLTHASNEPTRHILMGVNVSKEGLVAADGRRLAWAKVAIKIEPDLIVPSQYVPLAVSALRREGAVLSRSDKALRVTHKQGEVTCKLVEGRFVNWRQVIPADLKPLGKLETPQLLAAVKSVQPFTTEKWCSIKLTFDAKGLTVESRSPDVGDRAKHVAGKFQKLTIAIDPQYLAAALAIHGPQSELFFADEVSPLMIKSGELTTIVMPMRQN